MTRTGSQLNREYLWDHTTDLGREQLDLLGTLLDVPTTGFLGAIGIQPGWRCMDLGAGAGSISRWLAERAGPSGAVLAVDLVADHLTEQPGIEVYQHDIHAGLPVDGSFDLIHTRLLLVNLPRREEIFTMLVDALAPGGWLVIADGCARPQHVLSSPSRADETLFHRVMDVAMNVVAPSAGVSWQWADEVDGHMADAGLVNLHTTEHGYTAAGGTPGAQLYSNYIQQMQTPLLNAGVTSDELRRFHELLRDSRFRVWCYLRMVFTRGQKPVA